VGTPIRSSCHQESPVLKARALASWLVRRQTVF
jgi:hypothetical protein